MKINTYTEPEKNTWPFISTSQSIFTRFTKRILWRQIMAITYIALMCSYLYWRITIINSDSLLLSLTYYFADILGFILGLALIISSQRHQALSIPTANKQFSVDVFVPVYKEPLHIISRTLMAAKSIHYPHKTYVLDDGCRPEIKKLAMDLNIEYLCRSNNNFAKAGNLNHGLKHSHAEMIMVLDADHIVMPNALDYLLGHFHDANVAMVQTPQDFYNVTAFPYMNDKKTGALWHDHSFFFNMAQASGEAVNASTCVGTGVIYRRSALNAIGGFPTETITEDFHSSIKFHKLGYPCIYTNDSIAYGVAAADLDEFYTTRHRWTHGNLHAAVVENILWSKGLTIKQRLHYLCLLSPFLEGWQQIALLLVPIIALSTGQQPFEITILNVLIVTLFPIFSHLLLSEVGCGFLRFWAGELFSMARWPIYLKSTLAFFNYKLAWKSSTKIIKGSVSWALLTPQIIICVLSLAAVVFGILQLEGEYTVGPIFLFIWTLITEQSLPLTYDINAKLSDGYTTDLVIIAGAWAIYNAYRILALIFKTIYNAKDSHEFFRFKIPFPIRLDNQDNFSGYTETISEDWIKINLYKHALSPTKGETLNLFLALPTGEIDFKLSVQKINKNKIEGKIIWDKESDREALASCLYSVDWHREFITRHAFIPPLSNRLHSLFEGKNNLPLLWRPILYGENAKYGILGYKQDAEIGSFISFDCYNSETTLLGNLFENEHFREIAFTITATEPLSSHVSQGLNGIKWYRYKVNWAN